MHLSPAQREDFTYLRDALATFAQATQGVAGADDPTLLYGDAELIERFLRSDAGRGLDETQQRTVRNFVSYRRGQFQLVKQYKKYAVLMDQNRLYGVVGTADEPDADVIEHELPVTVRATLLPYRNNIVVSELSVSDEPDPERTSRSDIEYEFKQIKDVRGITETLDPQSQEEQLSPSAAAAERKLRMYLKTAATRDQHIGDIQKILKKHPELQDVYMQMYSKITARAIKKELKSNGVRERHFAVYNNSVVAVAPTRGELLEQLSDLSFDGMMGQCALFRV